MSKESWNLMHNFVPSTYIKQAQDAARTRENNIQQLLYHKKIPKVGWSDMEIESLLLQLSSMDSNNFPSNCGVGEREGRFASELVARRHYRFGHGIGRSGDLTEPQPKAAGSSLMYSLTNVMLKDLMSLMGITSAVECVVVPTATGLALVLSMLSLRPVRPNAKYVLWSRIDQKACFKSIITAGFTPVIIDTIPGEDQLVTNIPLLKEKINELGCENVICVMSTTSCFAPRAADSIEDVAVLCREHGIPHLINNAYGLQSKVVMKRIQKAQTKGRVDLFVQSTDKNLMVPVGGAIVCSFNKELLQSVSKIYPGRASSTPIMDTFITLLSLGAEGYAKLCSDRDNMFNYLNQHLADFAKLHGERVLTTPDNPISIAMSLKSVPQYLLTKVGSMLFLRNVSGTRVVTTVDKKAIGGWNFEGWGAHTNNYAVPYLTAAASLGVKKEDVDLFIKRLGKVFKQLQSKEQERMKGESLEGASLVDD